MNFTDIFIKRPVLATVVSLVILLVGIRSFFDLPVRQFPKVESSVVSVHVHYTGATAKLMEGFVATPLENAIAGVDGIDYIKSKSTNGNTSIIVRFKLGTNIDSAFSDVSAKVSSVRYMLPKDVNDPVISKSDPDARGTVFLTFSNTPNITQGEVSDYLVRVVQPQLQSLNGVGAANILGSSEYAMRIWLNPELMAAHGVTYQDVQNTLLTGNIQSPAGVIKGALQQFSMGAITDLNTAKQFNNLVIKKSNGGLTRISDVGEAKLGSASNDFSVFSDGKKSVIIQIVPKSNANPLTVSSEVDKLIPTLQKNLPQGITVKKAWDSAKFIRASIEEVAKTILEASLFVILVVFLFLGSIRILLIPAVTIPLSLIGVCGLMLAMGYSINTLTLMAMVLAIGMVVDDAIVVSENIHRHITEGKKPFEAALFGTREIMFAVISITLTLAAVYAPIGFLTGITGALFKEFAFTLASTVVLSGFIALTLSPMMCSKIMTHNVLDGKFAKRSHAITDKIVNFYTKILNTVLHKKLLVIATIGAVLAACVFLYISIPSDLAPKEDVGGVFVAAFGPADANISYMEKYTKQIEKIYSTIPEKNDYILVNGAQGTNTAFSFLSLVPWNKRDRSSMQIISELSPKLWAIPGIMAMAFNPSILPGAGSFTPVELVLQTTGSYKELESVSQKLLNKIRENQRIINVQSDLKMDLPQYNMHIDRNKAADLGISMDAVANTISLALGQPTVGQFAVSGRSYYVIPQLSREFRDHPENIDDLQLRTASGALIPLSNLVTLKQVIEPENLNHFEQLRSATIKASLAPGYSLGDALNYLQKSVKVVSGDNQNIQINYSGESRQFMQESNAMLITFIFALIFIFLILAAQFESFKSPMVVMITVPLSTVGALLLLKIIGATLNIYSEIGLVTLIGLISKHGILMVEFANQLREQGKDAYEAIRESATIRLRPILMTTSAMILGALPLALATGAGAISRSQIGWVIIGGMSIGTLFTLFVIPTMYVLITKSAKYEKVL